MFSHINTYASKRLRNSDLTVIDEILSRLDVAEWNVFGDYVYAYLIENDWSAMPKWTVTIIRTRPERYLVLLPFLDPLLKRDIYSDLFLEYCEKWLGPFQQHARDVYRGYVSDSLSIRKMTFE